MSQDIEQLRKFLRRLQESQRRGADVGDHLAGAEEIVRLRQQGIVGSDGPRIDSSIEAHLKAKGVNPEELEKIAREARRRMVRKFYRGQIPPV